MTKSSGKFEKIYKSLNARQREAVDAIEGPVMVVAGPGTGKTQILTARVANILLKTDVNPANILALTFTESGAYEMQRRLIEMMGETAYYVNISTFHAFCSDIIKNNPEEFVLSQDLEPLSELERIHIFREIIDENDLEKIKPFGAKYYYVSALIRNIQDLKRESVDAKELLLKIKADKTLEAKDQEKIKELAKVYDLYQKKLQEKERYDFEDMINLVVAKFEKDEDFLRRYQEKFQYILVDEFQDTNSAQNEVVMLLALYWGEQANIFVVGDDEQSIYRFQGASLENFYLFLKQFPKSLIVTLTENYRSTQLILDASRSVIEHNEQSIEKVVKGISRKLKTVERERHSDKSQKIEVCQFRNNLFENMWVAGKIKKLIVGGVKPSQICVLYRNNADAVDLVDIFKKEKILFQIEGGDNLLDDLYVKQMLYLFKVLLDLKTKNEDIDLFTLLNYDFLKFDQLDVLKLARFASQNKINMFEAMETLRDKTKSIILNEPDHLFRFSDMMVEFLHKEKNVSFAEFFEHVLNKSGFLDFVLRLPNSIEVLGKINSFFSEVKKINRQDHLLNLEMFFENLKLLKEHNIPLTQSTKLIENDVVNLMTAHKAKGREFEQVFLIKFVDKKWGNNRERELFKLPQNLLSTQEILKKEKNEDERRLFYVSLTRAKHGVYITSSNEYQNSESNKQCNPSLFKEELPSSLISCMDTSGNEKNYVQKYFASFKNPDSGFKTQDSGEKQFLLDVVKEFRLNVTALNTYLQCPYKFKLNTLLKTPRAKDRTLSLGTAVHKALELFFKHIKDKRQVPNINFLHEEFEKALKFEILSENDYKDSFKKGQKLLSAYYQFHEGNFKRPLFTEKFFGYGFHKIYLDNIPLVGKVDKIEFVDEEKKAVKVVDYKTGKHRSRNDIEGLTESSDGGYKRQLVFYKLLADLDRDFNLRVVETELDFVEPDEKGAPKRESFVISDDEVQDLKKVIREVMKDIRELKFERTTDYRICARCEYCDHCWPDGIPVKYKIEEKQMELWGE